MRTDIEILDQFEDNATNYFYTEQDIKAAMQLQRDAYNQAITNVMEYIRTKNIVQVEAIERLKLKR